MVCFEAANGSRKDPEFKARPFRPLRAGLVKRSRLLCILNIADRRRSVPRSRSVISIEIYCAEYFYEFTHDLESHDFSSFPNLEQFFIGSCNLEGNIREQIGMLLNLPHLSLRGNYLKGTLPVSLNLTKLLVLNLSRNNFTSTIPSQIGNLKNLLHLNLKDSQFSCLIPSSLGSMVNLTYLDLSRNNFIGLIPSSLGSMVNITYFDLRHY
ncbi:MDIS1-interacting receptor like kinase 2-like protein [Tanacetum coccineum]